MVRQVNRYLKDKHFDRIDHALGRPVDPMGKTYRNHYAQCDPDTTLSMSASPHWQRGVSHSNLIFFHVTKEGRAALSEHLKSIGDRNRLYTIEYEGHQMSAVGASASKARYSKWLDIADCCPDLSFPAFCRASTVRLARPTPQEKDL